jgi:lipopolysaccharide biosynthesis regulator YciM
MLGTLLMGAAAVAALIALSLVISRKDRSEDQARAYLLGFSYVLSENPDAAIAELSRAAELSTQTLETYFAMGALFRRKGDLDRAVRLHQNMLLHPRLEADARRRAQLELAMDFRASGVTNQAIEALEKLLDDAPAHREALVQLRQLREEAGEWEAAAELQARHMALEGTGQSVLSHHLAALARVQAKSAPQQAVATASRAVDLSPDSADAQLALGEALISSGRTEAARAALARAMDLEPELAPRALPHLAAAMEPEEVTKLLSRRVAEGLRAAPFELALALHQRARGDASRAIATLRALADRHPRFWEARKELGALLLAQDRSDEVRAEYQELLGTLGQPPMGFVCKACRQKLLEHAFRCPACQAWDTVAREDAEPAPATRTSI